MTRSITVLALGACLVASSAAAAPTAKSSATPTTAPASAPAKAFKAKPMKKARAISKWEASVPTQAERASAGGKLSVKKIPWATVSVRDTFASSREDNPYAGGDAGDRAALAFDDAEIVDARSGWAQWKSSGGTGLPGMPGTPDIPDAYCELFGIGCGPDAEPGMRLWINASAGHDYLAVCRVKFDDGTGDVTVLSDAGSTMTTPIDHTGKSSGKVSFLIDTDGAGWYGVTISSESKWSSTGCTVDEV